MTDLLHLLDRNETPPDKFRWTCPHCAWRFETFAKKDWFDTIENHFRMNPDTHRLPENWKAEAEHQMCSLLPPGWCAYTDGRPQDAFIDQRMTMDMVLNGTRVLVAWTMSGMKVVSQEVAEKRAATCAACYMRAPVPGCGACVGIANLVAEAIGGRSTKSDQYLENSSCLACGCSAKANVWVPVEISQAGVSDAAMKLFPKGTFCWKATRLRELRNIDNATDLQ